MKHSPISCPKCRIQMGEFPLSSGTMIDFCSQCNGAWFDKGELGKTCGKRQDFPDDSIPVNFKQSEFSCARCGESKKLFRRFYASSSVEVEFCKVCNGIFLDCGELESAQALLKTSPTTKSSTSSKRINKDNSSGLNDKQDKIILPIQFYRYGGVILLLAVLNLLAIASPLKNGIIFLFNAETSIGKVVEVTSQNSSCQNWISAERYFKCTSFTATLQYRAKDNSRHFGKLNAGRVNGREASPLLAELQEGMEIPILYEPVKFKLLSRKPFWSKMRDVFWYGWENTSWTEVKGESWSFGFDTSVDKGKTLKSILGMMMFSIFFLPLFLSSRFRKWYKTERSKWRNRD